jgi:hypothetical protein
MEHYMTSSAYIAHCDAFIKPEAIKGLGPVGTETELIYETRIMCFSFFMAFMLFN